MRIFGGAHRTREAPGVSRHGWAVMSVHERVRRKVGLGLGLGLGSELLEGRGVGSVWVTKMIVVMEAGANDPAIESVIAFLVAAGFDVHRSSGATRTTLGVVGDVTENDAAV